MPSPSGDIISTSENSSDPLKEEGRERRCKFLMLLFDNPAFW